MAFSPVLVGTADSSTPEDDTGGYFPPNLKASVYAREGSRADQISSKGAVGRGQIIPPTAIPYLWPGADSKDPELQRSATQLLLNDKINSEVMDKHLGVLWNKYKDPTAVYIAYYSGDYNADKWLSSGRKASVLAPDIQHYAGIGPNAKVGAPGWYAAPSAIESEQKRSNTEVVEMSPEQYLGLLPPLEGDEAGDAKRDNLRKSLLAGDNIEAIPSIEVKPARGGSLRIVDHDGRNRAQAAIDAGLDTIPVAVRGVPKDRQFANLIGREKVPYNFNKLTLAPPVVSTTPAPVTAPVSTVTSRTPVIPAAPNAPARVETLPVQPVAPGLAKPDFYPEIVGGLNRELRQPTGEPYRGLVPTSPADNMLASDKIAAANARSAGQVGLGPNAPTNALSSLASTLAAFNPIGSAQAAEVQPPAMPRAPVGEASSATFSPVLVGEAPGFTPTKVGEAPTQPTSWIPGPGKALQAFGEAVVNPIGNFLTAPLRGVAANIYGNVMGGMQGGLAGIDPGSAAFQAALQRPPEGGVARPVYNTIAGLPENAVGRWISNYFLGAPALLAWGAEKVLGAGADIARGTPWGTTAQQIDPYFNYGMNFLGAAGMHPKVANALTVPVAPVLRHWLRSPEEIGVGKVNRALRRDVDAGGFTSPQQVNVTPAEVSSEIQDANTVGKPLTTFDFILPNEQGAHLFSRSLENSPVARANTRTFLRTRMEGTRASPESEPTGGTLDRLDKNIRGTFGSGSARELGNKVAKDIKDTNSLRDMEAELLDRVKDNISVRNKQLQATFFDDPSGLATVQRTDSVLRRLRAEQVRRETEIKRLDQSLEDSRSELQGLKWGQSIYSPSVRAEDFSKFLQKAKPKAVAALKTGVSDAARDRLRQVPSVGREASEIDSPQSLRNKFTAAAIDPVEAANFLRNVDWEGQMTEASQAGLRVLGGESREEAQSGARLRRAAESLGHVGTNLAFPGTHIYGGWYWILRASRNLADYLAGGGRFVRAGSIGTEAVNALLDPNVTFAAPGGRSLLETPPRSPRREQIGEGIRRILPFGLPGSVAAPAGP